MFEKRQSPRLPVDEKIVFTKVDGGEQSAQVLDLSAEGLRMRVDEELDAGATVYLEMDFLQPDFGDSVEIEAEVQHSFQESEGGAWQSGLKMKIEPEQKGGLMSRMASLRTE